MLLIDVHKVSIELSYLFFFLLNELAHMPQHRYTGSEKENVLLRTHAHSDGNRSGLFKYKAKQMFFNIAQRAER